jgi:hypothetical protein
MSDVNAELAMLRQVRGYVENLQRVYARERDTHSPGEDSDWGMWNYRQGALAPVLTHLDYLIADRVDPDHPEGWDRLGEFSRRIWNDLRGHLRGPPG